MKGAIQPDHIPLNKYSFIVAGLAPMTFTTVSGLEEELENVELPDRTAASGGNTKPIEFTATHPMHHLIEQAAMETWYLQSQDPVDPTYKKAGTIVMSSLSGLVTKRYMVSGVFPCKRKTGDLDMNNEGELHQVEWTFKADQVIPI